MILLKVTALQDKIQLWKKTCIHSLFYGTIQLYKNLLKAECHTLIICIRYRMVHVSLSIELHLVLSLKQNFV